MQDIAAIFRHNENISFTRCHDGDVFFLLQKPDENNAQVLMRLTREGQLQRLTAPGTSVRSRLHEYGAMPYAIGQNAVYFCKHDTQQIACQRFNSNGADGTAVTLTPDLGQALLRYGDFVVDSKRNQLIAVREDYRDKKHGEPRNCLVAIDLNNGGEGRILFDQSDFVINPRLSADGRHLAFVSWDHPYMPWDQTHLWVATLDAQGEPETLREVIQPQPGAIQQVQFSTDGDLYFLADWTDWWNLYRLDAQQLQASDSTRALMAPSAPLCERPHDCAGPPWVPGPQHYTVIDRHTVALATLRDAHWYVEKIDLASGQSSPLWSGVGAIDALCAQDKDLILGFSPVDRPPAIERWVAGPVSGTATIQPDSPNPGQPQLLLQCRSDAWQQDSPIQRPQHLSYPCTAQSVAETEANIGGLSPEQLAHGLLYLPPDTTTPPPLLVMVHGGPTGTARSAFNPFTQFWVQQGFAVFDVNHRGSSGYGRRYRQLLLGQWGAIDIEDIVAGVQYLIASKQVDPSRIVIRGGSAGGYAVLAALAQSDLFRAGTCCYGISDLISLAAETHKFESRYVERLIGPLPQAEAVYRARSPIHQLDRIQAPVLWLHGALDKVVPPNQATDIMAILQARSPASRYVCFDDEGHGFRLPANQISALNEELLFYQTVGALKKPETD